MKKSVTIHDIAREANVSSATVSRVLSNSTYTVSSVMREKIQRTAAEMRYIPNLFAKQLKTNTNTNLGIIIPSITNPFYSSVILGVEQAAHSSSYQILLCNSLHDPKLEEEYVRMMLEKRVRGLIISSISENKKMLQQLIDLGMNVITLDQNIEHMDVCKIAFDYRKGGYMAASYMIGKGHRSIAYVTSPLNRSSRKSIYEGYVNAMTEHGLELIVAESEYEEAYNTLYEFDNGRKLTRRLMGLPKPPTAIFACNDMTAFGAMKELAEMGIAVPEDVSVMGFDGIDFGRMVTPTLTTIKQQDYEMGRLACNMMLDLLNGGKKPPMDTMLEPHLIENNSVAARIPKSIVI